MIKNPCGLTNKTKANIVSNQIATKTYFELKD